MNFHVFSNLLGIAIVGGLLVMAAHLPDKRIDTREQPGESSSGFNRECITRKYDPPSKIKKIRTCVWEHNDK